MVEPRTRRRPRHAAAAAVDRTSSGEHTWPASGHVSHGACGIGWGDVVMKNLLRFLLLLRPSAREDTKGNQSARAHAKTTRSLSLLLSLPFWQADRYFPD